MTMRCTACGSSWTTRTRGSWRGASEIVSVKQDLGMSCYFLWGTPFFTGWYVSRETGRFSLEATHSRPGVHHISPSASSAQRQRLRLAGSFVFKRERG